MMINVGSFSHRISHGDDKPTDEEFRKYGSNLMRVTCELLTTVLTESPPTVKKNESRILAMTQTFETALHRIFANVAPNMSFEYESPKLKVFVWRLGEKHPYAKGENIRLDLIDLNGVTKHFKQGGRCFIKTLGIRFEKLRLI